MSQETMTSSNSNNEYQQTTLNHDDRHQSHAVDSSTPSKPIRRRPRALKKTPTTLLKANANNFRALVQEFTGCPNISLANQKGPVNLNFGLKNETPIVEPFCSYRDYRRERSQPEVEVLPQINQQQQQRSYNLQENNYYNIGSQDHQSTYYSSLSNNAMTSSDVLFNPTSNGFVPDENYDLSINEFAHSGLIFD